MIIEENSLFVEDNQKSTYWKKFFEGPSFPMMHKLMKGHNNRGGQAGYTNNLDHSF
jgi:hypothetical protein